MVLHDDGPCNRDRRLHVHVRRGILRVPNDEDVAPYPPEPTEALERALPRDDEDADGCLPVLACERELLERCGLRVTFLRLALDDDALSWRGALGAEGHDEVSRL